MPTIKYSNNPNSDTAFVVQDGGQKNRAVLTAEPAGTLQLSDSANVSTGYVTDEDGKKHKVNLVAQLEGDIEFSENPNSTKGYATVDGKKHRVVLTASLAGGGGSAPVIDELNVTPSTSAQVITAPEGTDGYSPVNVAAVTSAIDANITAGNIKKDVSILGVTGSYEGVAPAHYLEFVNNSGTLERKISQIDFTGITNSGTSLYNLFSDIHLKEDTTFSLIPITTIDGKNGMSSIFGNSMSGNNYNFNVDMSSVKTISGSQAMGNAFSNTSAYTGTGILSVDFSGLETVTGTWALNAAFRNSPLKQISFPKLSIITTDLSVSGNQAFFGCKILESVSFGGLKSTTFSTKQTQLQYLFNADSGSQATNGCTVHFPTNFDPSNPDKTFDASTLPGYPTFGGSASYIHLAFDLPATES